MRRRTGVLSGVALVSGLTAALLVVGVASFESHPKGRFDRKVWLKPVEPCTSSVRGRMVDDLVSAHLKVGMLMSRVRKLLGTPDEVSDGTWFYSVSAERNLFLPTCVGLELFVTQGRLERAEVTRDD